MPAQLPRHHVDEAVEAVDQELAHPVGDDLSIGRELVQRDLSDKVDVAQSQIVAQRPSDRALEAARLAVAIDAALIDGNGALHGLLRAHLTCDRHGVEVDEVLPHRHREEPPRIPVEEPL